MKIETGTVSLVRITDVKGLDPIRVTLDDIGPGKGRINIECYGQAWASYWGGMGGKTIAQFFASCDNCYLISNLAEHIDRTVFSGEQFVERCQKRICKMRRSRELDSEKAREYFDDADDLTWCEGTDALVNTVSKDFLHDIYGAEWWYGTDEDSQAQHPQRAYLSRIIDAVRAALQTLAAAKEGAQQG
ncbi:MULTISPECIES: hypothetical protein [Comamonas]|uniref:hypothetical protein n=1 Tax=Comamonas TaxID=283 RepID=UPI0006227D4E|nr:MULTISPECIES: hypothetical protein [Comamonas]KKI11617.1 hypothetical protein XA67_23900 [Comamonas thiooxydans]TYK71076.1 hypothetical protein FSY45_23720 [Comamonas sp. Z1]BCX53916.1 hypothetical protein CTYAZ2_34960 [Comamonas testosteroni]